MRARLAALISLATLTAALLAPQTAAAQPASDFGTAPSGSVPILFNDHHVYARPDKLKEGRVLAALVRGGTVLIPLRSMFEQMGATVSYDANTKTVDVTKAGSDVKVTVGKAEVVINGEQRPLDVPPEIYEGTVVVPVRVISEGMGAYVQWVPDKRVVVVRYLPATPPPAPPAPPAPTEPPATAAPAPPPPATPSPTPTAVPRAFDRFVAGDYVISPKVYNELANGNSGNDSFDVKAAIELPVGAETLMVGGTFRQFQYPHDSFDADTTCTNPGSPGCRTVVGNGSFRLGTCPSSSDPGCVTVPGYQHYVNQLLLGQAYVPAFTAQERDADGRIGLRVADPRIYLALSYYGRSYNYLGYPSLSGVGFGIEKLPDLERPVSLYGSAFLYPAARGNYTGPVSPLLGSLSGASFTMQYTIVRYEIGAAYALGRSPFFVETKFLGDRADAHADAPASFSHTGGSVGIGLHF